MITCEFGQLGRDGFDVTDKKTELVVRSLLQIHTHCYTNFVTQTLLQTLCYKHFVTNTLLQTFCYTHFVTNSRVSWEEIQTRRQSSLWDPSSLRLSQDESVHGDWETGMLPSSITTVTIIISI